MLQPPSPDRPRLLAAITVRSVLLGLAGVCFVCGLTAYNDFVMENTFLVGNFLPIGLLLFLLVLVLGVNVPLRRLVPRHALRQGELAVVTLMVLVACSVPSSGLMRYLPGGIVGILGNAADRPADYGVAVDAAKVPDWLLPTVSGSTAAEKGYDPVVTQFRARSPDGRVPWAAWVRPFFTWGVLILFVWGLLISLSLIVRKQWVENERLSFPLATLYQSLIETPAPGHAFNSLFRSRGFWIAAGGVFVVRGLNALNAYDPSFPRVPLGFDFREMLVDPPWSYTHVTFKTADLFFAMIGIAFFIQTKTAFSLWFCFILWQVEEMITNGLQVPVTDTMRLDQSFGAMITFAAVVVYLGRRHWWMVLRHMVGRRRAGEGDGFYLPYAASGWTAAVCFAGVIGWFTVVGMTFPAALALATGMTTVFMVVARVLADTGLIFVQINASLLRPFYYPVLVPATPQYTTATNFFFAGWMTQLFHDVRESLAAFFQLGVKVADDAIDPTDRPRRVGYGLLAAVALSLGVAYTVSWVGMLNAEYTYAQTAGPRAQNVNDYGVERSVQANVLDTSLQFQSHGIAQERRNPIASPLLHVGIGGALVAVCSIGRVWLAWWPIHPVALVVVYSFALQKIWFSIFVGWLAKVCVIRFGGASLLRSGRSTFMGLIVGDAFAAAFWLVINLVLNFSGYAYKPQLFLPG